MRPEVIDNPEHELLVQAMLDFTMQAGYHKDKRNELHLLSRKSREGAERWGRSAPYQSWNLLFQHVPELSHYADDTKDCMLEVFMTEDRAAPFVPRVRKYIEAFCRLLEHAWTQLDGAGRGSTGMQTI